MGAVPAAFGDRPCRPAFPPLPPPPEPRQVVVPREVAAAIAELGRWDAQLVDPNGAVLGRFRPHSLEAAERRERERTFDPARERERATRDAAGEACSAEELWAYVHRDRTQPWSGENIPSEGPAVLRGADAPGEEPGRDERKEAA